MFSPVSLVSCPVPADIIEWLASYRNDNMDTWLSIPHDSALRSAILQKSLNANRCNRLTPARAPGSRPAPDLPPSRASQRLIPGGLLFRRFVFSSAVSASALVFAALPAAAQRAGITRSPAASIAISPYVGYMTFGNLVDGPLSTRLSSASAPVYGAQVNLPLSDVVSIVGNVAYTEPDLRAGVPIVGDFSVGKSSVWLYDAGLQLSAPGYGSGGRGIFPFVQVGGGAMRYDVQVSGLSRIATNAAFTAGIGADIPLAPNIGIRLAARDYIGKFDFNQATSLDVNTKTSNNVALSAGLKLGF